MALTKINFEVEVEDTFQNGKKLDLNAMYRLLGDVASAEYNNQFEANRITKHFQISMKPLTDAAEAAVNSSFENSEEQQPMTQDETDDYVTEAVRRRRSGTGLGSIKSGVKAGLFLPK